MSTGTETQLSILHFNDVYRVTPQKLPDGGTVDVTQFAWLVDDLRNRWAKDPDGTPSGLFLFSGDVFSPSVESSVTRGSHMVPVLNELKIDVSVTGNHDFDFGYPHLSTLIQDTQFPWLLSNIIDSTTNRIPAGLQEFTILERAGIRIGVIGLVEREWIATVASWPSEFQYRSMKDTSIDLSRRLRDPEGEYRCDIIIALTHSRLPNDIDLAKELLAFTPSHQKQHPVDSEHGADILLGGHDHIYFVGKGVDEWENFNINEPTLGAEKDDGDILVVKSGSDFRDISELQLTLRDASPESVRKKVISHVKGIRHVVASSTPKSEPMAELLKKLLSSVSSTLKAPVCHTTVMLDLRGYHIRVTESAAGNWFADVIRHAYDDSLHLKDGKGADGVLICAGTLRGDSTYGPGVVTLGDIMEILPFEDPIIVIEADGETIWNALEAGLEKWPAQEGRFPVISGFKVTWDSRKAPGERVTGVWLEKESNGDSPNHLALEPINKEKGGKLYRIVTREYMADGHDGYLPLKDCNRLIDGECGTLMSSIVRKYLIGSHFVNKIIRMQEAFDHSSLSSQSRKAISYERGQSEAKSRWKNAVGKITQRRAHAHYQNRLNICSNQHMSSVDVFDGATTRKGGACSYENGGKGEDLLVVSPEIDGRLKDEAAETEA